MTVAVAPGSKVKLRVADFDLLAESGGLAGLGRTELLDGDIYLMAPQFSRHGNAKAFFYEALLDWARIHRPDLVVRSEVSVAMPPNDQPIPDVILTLRPRGRRAIPVAGVALLVEVSNDSLDDDLGRKADLYARQGVPEYWVVDLDGQRIVQHSGAGSGGYRDRPPLSFGQPLTSTTLQELTIDTTDLLDEID